MSTDQPPGPQQGNRPLFDEKDITLRFRPAPYNIAETSQTLITVYDSFRDFFQRLWPRVNKLPPKDELKEFLEILWIYAQSYGNYLHHEVGGIRNALRLKATVAVTLNVSHPHCREINRVIAKILDTSKQVMVPAQEFSAHALEVERAIGEVVETVPNDGPGLFTKSKSESGELLIPDELTPVRGDAELERALPGIEESEVFYLLFYSIDSAASPEMLVHESGKNSLLVEIFRQYQLKMENGRTFISQNEAGALLFLLARRMRELQLSKVEMLSHIALVKAVKIDGKSLLSGEDEQRFLELLGAESEEAVRHKAFLDSLPLVPEGEEPDFFGLIRKIAHGLGEKADFSKYPTYTSRLPVDPHLEFQRQLFVGVPELLGEIDFPSAPLTAPDLPPASIKPVSSAPKHPSFSSFEPELAIRVCQFAVAIALIIAMTRESTPEQRFKRPPASVPPAVSIPEVTITALAAKEPDAALTPPRVEQDAGLERDSKVNLPPSTLPLVSKSYFDGLIVDHKKSLPLWQKLGFEKAVLVQNKYGPGLFSIELIHANGKKSLIRDRNLSPGQTEITIEPLP
ncbi:hypothetical protein HY605_00045 [Candidatus Peregrinibacteria bacterium]|nr:hypothetical protein [Candidatus Peregrinibacteria bacterium]